jgi:putative transposase
LWQCDFFSKHVVTAAGVRQCFVIAFMHVATRRVWLSPCSFKPDPAWTTAQAESFLAHAKAEGLPAEVVLRDRDSKYTAAGFDRALAEGGVLAKAVGFRSPNMNAYVERFVQAIQHECLDRMIVFEREHLDHVCAECVAHYHAERPHQALGNRPPVEMPSSSPPSSQGLVVCRERLGGVLRRYERAA